MRSTGDRSCGSLSMSSELGTTLSSPELLHQKKQLLQESTFGLVEAMRKELEKLSYKNCEEAADQWDKFQKLGKKAWHAAQALCPEQDPERPDTLVEAMNAISVKDGETMISELVDSNTHFGLELASFLKREGARFGFSVAFNLSRIYNLSPLRSHAPLDAEAVLKAEKNKCSVDQDEQEIRRRSKEGILAAIDLQRRYKIYCQQNGLQIRAPSVYDFSTKAWTERKHWAVDGKI